MVAFVKDYDPNAQHCVANDSSELIAARVCVDILARLGCYCPECFQDEINEAVKAARLSAGRT